MKCLSELLGLYEQMMSWVDAFLQTRNVSSVDATRGENFDALGFFLLHRKRLACLST